MLINIQGLFHEEISIIETSNSSNAESVRTAITKSSLIPHPSPFGGTYEFDFVSQPPAGPVAQFFWMAIAILHMQFMLQFIGTYDTSNRTDDNC